MATNKPKPIPILTEAEIKRFWSLVEVRGPNECWPWIGGRFASGYGRFAPDDNSQNVFKASRIALFLKTGIDPGEDFACHSCDNPPCCNGEHLSAKPPAGNSEDMKVRGRAASGDQNGLRLHPESILKGDEHWTRKNPEFMPHGKDHWTNKHPEWISGERNPAAKLTREQVEDARLRYKPFVVTYDMLAAEFGVSRFTIMNAVRGKSFRHFHTGK